MSDRITEWFRKAKRQGQGYGFAPVPMRKRPSPPNCDMHWLDRLLPHNNGKLLFLTEKWFELLQPTEEERKVYMSDKPVWIVRMPECFEGLNVTFVGDNPFAAWVVRQKPLKRWEELSEQERAERTAGWPVK